MNPFKKRPNGQPAERVIILDTCALIDGRIVEIAKAGFVPPHLVVPQFVIAELQFLADQGDSHKRERARFGLDIIRVLQELLHTTVTIAREPFRNIKEVDDKLIALAKHYGSSAMLYTTDYNLNKVAQIEGVNVLNVNELAQALRPQWLPGERVEIKIIQVGQDNRQGVGYLEDGTMVVVEEGGRKLGQRILVECKRMLQTQAGKMMFATIVSDVKQTQPLQIKKPVSQTSTLPPRPTQLPEPRPAPKPQAVHFPINETSNLNRQKVQAQPKRHHAPQKQYAPHAKPKLGPEESLLKALEQSR